FWLGWGIVLASTFTTGFRTTLFYRVVRHPLNLGFIVAFWAAPMLVPGLRKRRSRASTDIMVG
ncbi:MAG: methanethiol S-methyltransferase, partial [Mycobacterium sp.]|nr:methanethiol S-methyltransferase [Mycobacterium sp.]